jgi:nucleoside 2-deoxyribosyltransferase
MKVFLSTSFSGQINPVSDHIQLEYQAFLEHILTGVRQAYTGEVYCALEAEGWELSEEPAEVGVQSDLTKIDESDVLLALISDKPSAGVQFEIGYAAAKGKRVIIASGADVPLAYINQGAVSLGLASAITYDTPDSLIQNVVVALNAPADEV